MKVVLVEPSFPEIHADDSIFPLGLAAVGAVLQGAGHRVEYVLPAASRLTIQDVADHLAQTDADLIGIGGLTPYLPAIIKLVAAIKAVRPEVPLVLGGPMVTYQPELVVKKSDADFCIAGEGEVALLKLVTSLESGTDYSEIPGLLYRRADQIVNNGWGESIPLPNWDDFPMDYYLYSGWYMPSWSRTKNHRVFHWILSRGCPLKCNFCVSGSEARYKTVDQAIIELRHIVDRFDPDYVLLADNFLTRNRRYTRELCEAMIANKFRFQFSCTARANSVNPELLSLLKQAGCQLIFYGLENGNDEILKFMNKGITVEQTIRAIKWTKEAGIHPHGRDHVRAARGDAQRLLQRVASCVDDH